MLHWLAQLDLQHTLGWGFIVAAVFEIVTCVTRFGLGLQSTRDTAYLARFTFGLRIHHGYPGVLMLGVGVFVQHLAWRNGLVIVGIGLLVSDLVHHFLVLWPITGSPEFHLTYPPPPRDGGLDD